MVVFTLLGLLIFWAICFQVGYGIAAAVDGDGLVMAVARCLVGADRLDKELKAFSMHYAAILKV